MQGKLEYGVRFKESLQLSFLSLVIMSSPYNKEPLSKFLENGPCGEKSRDPSRLQALKSQKCERGSAQTNLQLTITT